MSGTDWNLSLLWGYCLFLLQQTFFHLFRRVMYLNALLVKSVMLTTRVVCFKAKLFASLPGLVNI